SVVEGGQTRQVGGAAALKAYFDAERATNPGGTLVVTAGDAFGATPPLSAFFDDVPAVLAANLMGIDVDTLGNHNFDRGVGHLRALMAHARFAYVAANIVAADGTRLVPPSWLTARKAWSTRWSPSTTIGVPVPSWARPPFRSGRGPTPCAPIPRCRR